MVGCQKCVSLLRPYDGEAHISGTLIVPFLMSTRRDDMMWYSYLAEHSSFYAESYAKSTLAAVPSG